VNKIKKVGAFLLIVSLIACGGEEEGEEKTLPDTTPNGFNFSSIENASLSTLYSSEEITITGIDSPSPVTINCGLYSIDGATFISMDSLIYNNQKIVVRHTSSNQFIKATSCMLTIGGEVATFRVTTASEDTTPEAFIVNDVDDAEPESLVESHGVVVTGINTATPISITGGEYSIDGASYTRTAGVISPDQSVRLRLATPAQFNSSIEASLTIGGVSGIFRVNTRAPEAKVVTTFPVAGYFSDSIIDVSGYISEFYDDFTSIVVTVSSAGKSIQVPVDADGFWRAHNVNISAQSSTAQIEVSATNGSFSSQNTIVLNTDSLVIEPTSLVFDEVNNKFYIADQLLRSVVEFDPQTNQRRILSGPKRGDGPILVVPVDLILDNNRLLLLNSGGHSDDGLLSVDIATGDRSWISSNSIGSGPILQGPERMVLDKAGNRVFVTDIALDSVFAIELGDGSRSIVFDDSINSGNSIGGMNAIAFHHNEIIVGDDSTQKIFAYDISSGNSRVVSDRADSELPSFWRPEDFSINATKNLLYVSSTQDSKIIAINLDDGKRSVLIDEAYSVGGQTYSPETQSLYYVSRSYGRLIKYNLAEEASAELFNSRVGESESVMSYSGFSFNAGFDEILLNFINKDSSKNEIGKIEINSGKFSQIGSSPTSGNMIFDTYGKKILISTWRNGGELFEIDPLFLASTDWVTIGLLQDEASFYPKDLCVFQNKKKIFLASENKIIQLDRTTSEVNLLSFDDLSYGDLLTKISSIACDEKNDVVKVLDSELRNDGYRSLYDIDVTSKTRSFQFAFTQAGAQPNPEGIVYDDDRETLFLSAQGYNRGVWKLDGDNLLSQVSTPLVGLGPRLEQGKIALDKKNQRVLQSTGSRLYLIDALRGDRQIIFW